VKIGAIFFFFVILSGLIERGRIPTRSARIVVIEMFARFNYDLSNQTARFFTAFRMTFPEAGGKEVRS